MITINKDSWHYKLQKSWDGEYNIPSSLCAYTRRVVGFLGLSLFIISLIGVLLGTVASFIAGMLYTVSTGLYATFNASMLFGSLLVGITLAGVLARILEQGFKAIKRKLFKQDNKPKEPNIFIEYLKAIHDKVCPYLEVK